MTEQTAPMAESFQSPAVQSETVAETGRLSLQQLMWRRFLCNRMAVAGGIVLVLLYLTTVILAEFTAPYHPTLVKEDYVSMSPQLPRFIDQEGQFHLRPFVYGTTISLDMENLEWVHEPDYSTRYPIHLFTHGTPYKLFGVIPADIHLFGVEEPGTLFIFGSDGMGRCVFSRAVYGGRVSLTIGLIGVILTVVFGSSLGTISGYYGGVADIVLQRIIELLQSFPGIALWAALAAALPPGWPPIRRFFAISVILSFVSWTGLARQVRAKVLAYREMDYSSAARAVGASDRRIIFMHMLPNAFSHIIVSATFAIPGMILTETALSFLGLGIQPPMVSWGALLQDATTVSTVVLHPWLMFPALLVIIAVLSFNFVGDGLRDAVDPYSI